MKLTPPKLTPTDVARIYREVFGGSRHDETVRLFAEAVQSALTAKWLEMLEGQEAVAWLSIDPIGERFLSFTAPNDSDKVVPLYAAQVPAKAPMTDEQLCEALSIDGADDWTYEVRDAVERFHGITDGFDGKRQSPSSTEGV